MPTTEPALRRAVVEASRALSASGLNHGTSGNVSVRCGDRMLITPSAVEPQAMEPAMLAAMPLGGPYGAWDGPRPPSTEWRIHLDILRARPQIGAVVHTHATHCTVLAMARKPIPAAHYMIAAFGGDDVRCAAYATFGTAELSAAALEALEGRTACLLANHGMLALGASLATALWRAAELETLARTYVLSLAIGGPVLLDGGQVAAAARAFTGYGPADPGPATLAV